MIMQAPVFIQHILVHLQFELLPAGQPAVHKSFDGCQTLLTINNLFVACGLIMQPDLLER